MFLEWLSNILKFINVNFTYCFSFRILFSGIRSIPGMLSIFDPCSSVTKIGYTRSLTVKLFCRTIRRLQSSVRSLRRRVSGKLIIALDIQITLISFVLCLLTDHFAVTDYDLLVISFSNLLLICSRHITVRAKKERIVHWGILNPKNFHITSAQLPSSKIIMRRTSKKGNISRR